LSQARHCLLVTATQSDAGGYTTNEKTLLSPKNFSGSKTKMAHVNGMLGINVTADERTKQTARINWVVRRKLKGKTRLRRYVSVAGWYDVDNPVVRSR